MKPSYLGIEAVLCGLPSIVVGSVGALIFSGSGISMLGYAPAEGAQGIAAAVGIVLALWQYVSLAARTVGEEQYHFGPLFWVGLLCGSSGVWYAFNFFGVALGGAIALPIVGAAAHFVWLQVKQYKGTNNAV